MVPCAAAPTGGHRAVARDGEGLIPVTDWMRQGDTITAGGGAAGWRFHIGGLDQYSVALSRKLCFFALFLCVLFSIFITEQRNHNKLIQLVWIKH
jgi:hypothetical protein